jgi:hypothetical protein
MGAASAITEIWPCERIDNGIAGRSFGEWEKGYLAIVPA